MSIVVRATQRLRQPDAGRAPHAAPVWEPPSGPPPESPSDGDPDTTESGRRVAIAVDFAILKRAGFIDPGSRKSRLAEEFRLIKHRLLQEIAAARGDDGPVERPVNAVMVTSAHSHEGKTFTAINLAFSIAMGERRKVVLIDGDPVRRSVSTLLGLTDRPGLTDVLHDEGWGEGRRDPLDALVDCEGLPLSVMPAGTAQHSASDIFGSARMTSLMVRAAALVDDGLVIVDTPPILAMSEPLALAHQVGRVILVVAAGRTSRLAVGAALDRLDMDDRVSLILNSLSPRLSPAETDY